MSRFRWLTSKELHKWRKTRCACNGVFLGNVAIFRRYCTQHKAYWWQTSTKLVRSTGNHNLLSAYDDKVTIIL